MKYIEDFSEGQFFLVWIKKFGWGVDKLCLGGSTKFLLGRSTKFGGGSTNFGEGINKFGQGASWAKKVTSKFSGADLFDPKFT